jgi:hypothetical protein
MSGAAGRANWALPSTKPVDFDQLKAQLRQLSTAAD